MTTKVKRKRRTSEEVKAFAAFKESYKKEKTKDDLSLKQLQQLVVTFE